MHTKFSHEAFRRGYLGYLAQEGITPEDLHGLTKQALWPFSSTQFEMNPIQDLSRGAQFIGKTLFDYLPATAIGGGALVGLGGGALYNKLTRNPDQHAQTVQSIKNEEKADALKRAILKLKLKQERARRESQSRIL